jgi:23S rRNA (cytidine1920-2'-O)/16S rRNA (cytidine1409-2'-O)-methyltransferase
LNRRRLDQELVSRGLAGDSTAANELIEGRRVLVDGSFANSPAAKVSQADAIHVMLPKKKFVSRGGLKLDGALDDLRIDVRDRKCLDAGAGTGGFTDCLLQRGAATVTAVDVGYGQLDWSLRSDSRVSVIERTNIRAVDPDSLGGPYDLVVADLSFISLEAVAHNLVRLLAPPGDLIVLTKPQFEAPVDRVGPGGIVKDPAVWESTIEKVAGAMEMQGLSVTGVAPSRVKGAEGNQEFFLWARRGNGSSKTELIREALSQVLP